MRTRPWPTICTACLLLIAAFTARAQSDTGYSLRRIIMSRDSLLFRVGFNTCDIRQFENLLSDSFRFYHDKDGFSGKTDFIKALKKGLCASPEAYQSKRVLLSADTGIFPLHKNGVLYGAVQTGTHAFYERINGNAETYAGTARFTHLWLLENGQWKLSEGLSYDHRAELQKTIPGPDSDEAIEAWLRKIGIPVLGMGVIRHGQLQQIRVFGMLQPGVPAPYNTIFNVASLTKPVTAMVALKLASTGAWDLDEPVYRYWTDPDVAADPKHKLLTTRHILTHQTGFPNWRYDSPDGKLHFDYSPGTRYQYSGEGFEYLRKALERKTGKRLEQLAAALIFEPLQMTDTRYFWDAGTDSTRFATGYNQEGIPYRTVKHKSAHAADDLLTTVADYGKFLVWVMNGAGLSREVYTDMITGQAATKNGKHFGLGFEIYDLGDGVFALSHGGADEGVRTIACLLPQTGQGLVLFTNSDLGYQVYETLITRYLGEHGRKIIDIEMR